MGLDMYLYASTYISGTDYVFSEGKDTEIKESPTYAKIRDAIPWGGSKPLDSFASLKASVVNIEVMYWRKSNHIHRWFVETVQDGVDDCKTYELTIDQLMDLRALCIEVLEDPSKAKDVLPTQDGFFFGLTDYGEYYLEDVKRTLEFLNWVKENITEFQNKGIWFEYHSSW